MKEPKGKYSKNKTGAVRESNKEFEEDNNTVFGKNPVMEALRSGQTIDKLLILKDNRDHVLKTIADKAKAKGIIVQSVEKGKLESIAQGQPHQGIAALMAPFPYKTIDDVLALAESRDESPLIVILDHITDPHNLGAIIRSANLCGAHDVIIPKRRASGLSPAAVKASSGAAFYTPVVKVNNITQCIEELKAKGFWICAADMDGTAYYDNNFTGKMAVVIGNEGKGVGQTVRKVSDFIVSIPLYGDVDSFNASNAAAIILAEAAKQRH